MEQHFVCSKYDLTELYDRISQNNMSKYIALYQKDAKNFLKIASEAMTDASFFVAEWLNNQLGKKELERIFLKSFDFLTKEELESVKKLSYDRFEEEKEALIKIIENKLIKLLSISGKINLEGFSIFCMKTYYQELLFLVDSCLEEYWAKQEYEDFLELLHYFVTLEHSDTTRLYVVTDPEGNYHFFDESFNNITQICIQKIKEDFPETSGEVSENKNDILISMLVLLAPKKIFLYGTQFIANKNFIKTLQLIFKTKISFFESSPDFLPNYRL